MNDFDFGLQKVLNVRNIQEDIAQNKFMQARQRKKELENQLDRLNNTKKDTYDFIRNNGDSSVEITLQARRFLQLHKKKIEDKKEIILSQKEKVAEEQEKMIERQKKRKVLDRLKEKKYKAFQKEYLKNEQKLLDEIGQHLETEERV